MFICKHCKKEIDGLSTANKANHTRWCQENPKRVLYGGNSVKQFQTPEAISKRKEGIKRAHAEGKYDNVVRKRNTKPHSDATKELLRQKALASKHRRLVRSVRKYVRKDGSIVMLDSSWEEALAKRLDEIDIEWIRPEEPIQYVTKDGRTHNYFPDFYLSQYDLYLDPKNPAAINAQKEKLDCLRKIMNNLILIETLDDCVNFTI